MTQQSSGTAAITFQEQPCVILNERGISLPSGMANQGSILALLKNSPNGVGIIVDTRQMSGGGYMYAANENFSGVFDLSVMDTISLSVVAIAITRMPDGREIFSFKLLGNATFPPVQLGLGFMLTGLGVFAAVNCRMNETALRDAVYGRSLRAALFPSNVTANAVTVIADLNRFFPPCDNYYILGAMVELGWGPGKPLVHADLGVFIETGASSRVAIAGLVWAILPTEEHPLLELRVQALGIIDFNAKTLSIDASLFGSRIMDWTLNGDVAIRTGWGDNPRFLLSAGGFHPCYRPPSDLPDMRRLSMVLGDNPRIEFNNYIAIAEQTVQFGAGVYFSYTKKISLLVTSIKFAVIGYAAFDALFQFDPFLFHIIMQAGLAVKVNKKNVASIDVKLDIKGPNPYDISGYGKISVLCVTLKVKFDFTVGKKKPEISAGSIDPYHILKNELAEPGNWIFTPLTAKPDGVIGIPENQFSVRSSTDAVPPSGIKACFSQKSLPLGVKIHKFGNAKLAGAANYFDVKVSEGAGGSNVQEHFTRGQYFNLREEEQLSGTAFEKMKSGVLFEVSNGFEMNGTLKHCPTGYDTSILPDLPEEYSKTYAKTATIGTQTEKSKPIVIKPVVRTPNIIRVSKTAMNGSIKATGNRCYSSTPLLVKKMEKLSFEVQP